MGGKVEGSIEEGGRTGWTRKGGVGASRGLKAELAGAGRDLLCSYHCITLVRGG